MQSNAIRSEALFLQNGTRYLSGFFSNSEGINDKNVYSLNNTFEGKIWVYWKGKDGKMGQEISCREKPNISTLRKSPRIGTCVRVRGILNVNGTGTRVHSCKRLRPCVVLSRRSYIFLVVLLYYTVRTRRRDISANRGRILKSTAIGQEEPRVPNLWLRPAANNTQVYGNGCIQWYVNTSLRFWGHCLCRLKTSDRIGHQPMFKKKHRPSDRQAKLTSVDP